jgi:hypothetical protein
MLHIHEKSHFNENHKLFSGSYGIKRSTVWPEVIGEREIRTEQYK